MSQRWQTSTWIFVVVMAIAPLGIGTAASDDPTSYSFRVPLQIAAEGGLQRVELPVQALVSAKTRAFGDLRIFNAQGQAVPMALANKNPVQPKRQKIQLSAFQILGADDSFANSSVSLRFEDGQGVRVARLDTQGRPTVPNQKIIGALIDARSVDRPVVGLDIQAQIPNEQVIRFEVQASKDLQSWRSLAGIVMYRAVGTDLYTGRHIELSGLDLKDHYLRITWSDPVDAQVRVSGVNLITLAQAEPPKRLIAKLPVTLSNPHELNLFLPFAIPITALQIRVQGSSVLLPVHVLSRKERSQSWTLLASTVVYNLPNTDGSSGSGLINGPVDLNADGFREFKIEVDKKTSGFASLPEVWVNFEPVQIVFLANGSAPFTLAVGAAGAESKYLPLQSLIPDYQVGKEWSLPLTHVVSSPNTIGGEEAIVTVQTVAPSLIPHTRSIILWGVLIGGVAALTLMAWMLMKQMNKRESSLDER